MHRICIIVALIALPGVECLSAAAEPSVNADFYVVVDGDDRWSGTLPVTNSDSSDGPFATLTRARDAVRVLKRNTVNRDVVVLIRKGRYRLEDTVVFGLEDSGEGVASVTYAAWPGEQTVTFD